MIQNKRYTSVDQLKSDIKASLDGCDHTTIRTVKTRGSSLESYWILEVDDVVFECELRAAVDGEGADVKATITPATNKASAESVIAALKLLNRCFGVLEWLYSDSKITKRMRLDE